MPASAISLRRSLIARSSPGWPGLAWRGARLVELLKRALPNPPLPPCASTTRLAGVGEVGEQRLAVLVVDLGAGRHLEHDVVAVCAGAVLAHAATAGLGLEMLLIAVVDQGVEAIDGKRDHVSALAAVAAVRTAELDVFLAPERHAAVPAVARADVDLGFVQEFHGNRPHRCINAEPNIYNVGIGLQ